jgi:hypothetical protein
MKKQTSVELKKLNIRPIAPFPFHSGSFYRPVIISLYIVDPYFFLCREASRGYFDDLTRHVQTHTPQLGTLHVVNIGWRCYLRLAVFFFGWSLTFGPTNPILTGGPAVTSSALDLWSLLLRWGSIVHLRAPPS